VQTNNLRPPAVVIVGEVAQSRDAANWFTTRPLFGRTFLVTRPEHQADDLAAKLRGLGANVLFQPAIEIGPPSDWKTVDAAIKRLAEFDWLVFSSRNGVEYFFERLLSTGYDLRHVGQDLKLAAIGPGTAEALSDFHLRADLQPNEYRAEALAEALAPHARGKRFLIARASRGREVLAEALANVGATVEQVVVYESRDITTPNDDVTKMLADGRIDFTTVTSSAIACSLVQLFGDNLRKTKLAAISPLTASVLKDLGYPPAVVAETYTADGLLTAILASASSNATVKA
jgi:uroporphyrinogen III methyltransferase/synthase